MIGGMSTSAQNVLKGMEAFEDFAKSVIQIFPITLRRLASIFEGKFEDVSIINL